MKNMNYATIKRVYQSYLFNFCDLLRDETDGGIDIAILDRLAQTNNSFPIAATRSDDHGVDQLINLGRSLAGQFVFGCIKAGLKTIEAVSHEDICKLPDGDTLIMSWSSYMDLCYGKECNGDSFFYGIRISRNDPNTFGHTIIIMQNCTDDQIFAVGKNAKIKVDAKRYADISIDGDCVSGTVCTLETLRKNKE